MTGPVSTSSMLEPTERKVVANEMPPPPPPVPVKPHHANGTRLQKVATWVQHQQLHIQQHIQNHAAANSTLNNTTSGTTTTTTGGSSNANAVVVALQQHVRNFRRNSSLRNVSQTAGDVVDDSANPGVHGDLAAKQSSSSIDMNSMSKSTRGIVTALFPEERGGAGRKHRLTPNKERPVFPQRTQQIALVHDNYISDGPTTSEKRYRRSDSLTKALEHWIDATQTLLSSSVLHNVWYCSTDLGYQVVLVTVYTVTLPITLPYQICTKSLALVQHSLRQTFRATTRLILNKQQSPSESEVDECKDEDHSVGGIIHGLFFLPFTILGMAGNAIVSVVAPNLHSSDSASTSNKHNTKVKEVSSGGGKSRVYNDDYLNRLRLDYTHKDGVGGYVVCKNDDCIKPVLPKSTFLLRVNDLGLTSPEDENGSIYYVDFCPVNNGEDEPLPIVIQALDQLASTALQLFSSHPTCHLMDSSSSSTVPTSARPTFLTIDWHPEGATNRLLRQLQQQAEHVADFQRRMIECNDILLWSGRFRDTKCEDGVSYGRHYGFFMARGCVPMPTSEFMKLLWDNNRTSEYNHFCLGRKTLHTIGAVSEESILDGSAHTATKVIHSEMRVPIAGLTVKAICLMHIRPLPDGSGYVMVSRTLDTGPAGTHYCKPPPLSENGGGPAKHEILWGCNVIRCVPGQSQMTELTSLSQVASSVPSFLAHKIGLMGVADFFKNVRAVAVKAATAATPAASNAATTTIAVSVC